MPVPIRVSLNAMSNWCITREVHGRFVQFCRSSGNAKLAPVERIFDTNPHISWVLYSEPMAKVKNFQQWKARALAEGVPSEAVTSLKGSTDALRVMALRFIYLSTAGDVITGDLRDRGHFISATAETYLSQ